MGNRTPTGEDPSIAVLPFVNMSSDPEHEYFSDGLSEADDYLLEAIERDPGFAEAYEQLAYIYWIQAGRVLKNREGQKRTFEMARKALDLNPNQVGIFDELLLELQKAAEDLITLKLLDPVWEFVSLGRAWPWQIFMSNPASSGSWGTIRF